MAVDDLPFAGLAAVDVGHAQGVLGRLAIDRRRVALVAHCVSQVATDACGKTATQSKVTGRNGVAKFSTTAGVGTFRICVTAVTKAGTSYNPAANHVTCGTVTAP
jgi:predicted Zn-dependent protease